jgi:uncharacterized Tic20 family protein
MTPSPHPLTSEERILAALAHFMGLFVALIIWAVQKDKSPFVRFQATQIIFFDLAVMIITLPVVGLIMGCAFLTFLVGFGTSLQSTSSGGEGTFGTVFFIFPFLIWLLGMILTLGITVLRIVATIKVLQGQDFHYPWLGQRVEKFLGQ